MNRRALSNVPFVCSFGRSGKCGEKICASRQYAKQDAKRETPTANKPIMQVHFNLHHRRSAHFRSGPCQKPPNLICFVLRDFGVALDSAKRGNKPLAEKTFRRTYQMCISASTGRVARDEIVCVRMCFKNLYLNWSVAFLACRSAAATAAAAAAATTSCTVLLKMVPTNASRPRSFRLLLLRLYAFCKENPKKNAIIIYSFVSNRSSCRWRKTKEKGDQVNKAKANMLDVVQWRVGLFFRVSCECKLKASTSCEEEATIIMMEID